MSAILSADDLNDFISPGVACIKPVETLPKQAPPELNVSQNILIVLLALTHLTRPMKLPPKTSYIRQMHHLLKYLLPTALPALVVLHLQKQSLYLYNRTPKS